jgi:hypothetical protein
VTAAALADAPAALSSDELRALGRVAGAVLPPELLAGWHRDDTDVADTVAVRSLLARGVLQLRAGSGGPELALTGATRESLGPLLAARALTGVSLLARSGAERRQLVAEGPGGTLLLTEREPDVWTLEAVDGPVELQAARAAADLLDAGPRPEPGGVRIELPDEVLGRVERLVAQGRTGAATAALAEAGVPPAAAGTWTAVLARRVATGEVRVTRRLADGVFAGGAVRWVDAGEAGVWLVEAVDPAVDSAADPATAEAVDPEVAGPQAADPAAGQAGWSRLSDAGLAGVRAALAALLEGESR